MRLDEDAWTLETTLRLDRGRPRTVIVSAGRPGHALVRSRGPRPSKTQAAKLLEGVRHVLRLDEDLSGLYARVSTDPELSWVASGAGRMVRSPTVFEDTVKTICTTNCAWSATQRMVAALVEHLGESAAGPRPKGPWGRAFPTPEAMAEADESFYRDTVRAGYRGAYLKTLAGAIADGTIDLEGLAGSDLSDDEVAERLLALPGVGPYAAAHMMMLLGRYAPLILDSWTRPKYASLNGRKATDDQIARRFRRYREYAGLAFWLYITRDWVDDD